MIAIRKNAVLLWEKRASGIDQVYARQTVLQRNFLRSQVLLYRHRKVGSAFHGGVVRDYDALLAADAADPGDDAGAWRLVAVHAPGGKGRKLEKRRTRIEQQP